MSSRRLLESAARRYWHDAPWEALDDGDLIGFRKRDPSEPGESRVGMVSVLGAAGQQFGLSLFLGDAGPAHAARLSGGHMSHDELIAVTDFVSLTFEAPLARELRGSPWLLPSFKDQGRRVTPMFYRKPPHRAPCDPDDAITAFCTDILRAVPALIASGRVASLRDRDGADRRYPVFRLPAAPDGSFALDAELDAVTLETLPAAPAAPPPASIAQRLALRRPDGVLGVTFPMLPGLLEGGRAARALLVVDPATGRILDAHMFDSATAVAEAARRLFDLMTGDLPGGDGPLPAPKVVFTDAQDLLDAISPALAAAGIPVVLGENPELVRAKENFGKHMTERLMNKMRERTP